MATTNKQRSRTLTTRHRIMLPQYNKTDNRYYYAPMTGIKSGSTSLAGYCYVGSASLNGVDLISVVMYSSQYGVMMEAITRGGIDHDFLAVQPEPHQHLHQRV